jgi:hypothetical protein
MLSHDAFLDGLEGILTSARSVLHPSAARAAEVAFDGDPRGPSSDEDRQRRTGEAIRRLAFEVRLRRGAGRPAAAIARACCGPAAARAQVHGAVLEAGTLVEVDCILSEDANRWGERTFVADGPPGAAELARHLGDGARSPNPRRAVVRLWDGAEVILSTALLCCAGAELAAARPRGPTPPGLVDERRWAPIWAASLA